MKIPRLSKSIIMLGVEEYHKKHPNEECPFCKEALKEHIKVTDKFGWPLSFECVRPQVWPSGASFVKGGLTHSLRDGGKSKREEVIQNGEGNILSL